MLTDDEFVAAFEDCTIPKEAFHHEGHVRMAFLYLRRYDALEALRRFSTGLRRLAESLGKPERYHETITLGFLFLIQGRMTQDQDWAAFAAANPDLLDWEENLLKRYYREETLESSLARSVFVLPDRPFPR
jgi:N-formylglutamate deformylase